VKFYDNLFIEQNYWQPRLDGLLFYYIFFFFFSFLGGGEANWLKRPFNDYEVFEVVKVLNCDNASGTDGFTMSFVFHEFHARGMFEKSFNATISLILKKPKAVDMKDFRPISLVGGVHKILPNF